MPRRKPITSFLDAAATREQDVHASGIPSQNPRRDGLTSYLDMHVEDVGKEQLESGKERYGKQPQAVTLSSLLLLCSPSQPPALPVGCNTFTPACATATTCTRLDCTLTQKILTLDRPYIGKPKDRNMDAPPKKKNSSRRVKYTEKPYLEAQDVEVESPLLALTLHPANSDNKIEHYLPDVTASSMTTTDRAGLETALISHLHFTTSPADASTLDTASDMKGKNGRLRKQPSASPEQELVFMGRRSNEPSIANSPTKNSIASPKSKSGSSSLTARPVLAKIDSNANASAGKNWNGTATQPTKKKSVTSSWDTQAATTSSEQANSWKHPSELTTPAARDWYHQPAANSWAQTKEPAAQASGNWDSGHPPYQSANTKQQGEQQLGDSNMRPSVNDNEGSRNGIKGNARAPRESSWIKSSDIPKGDPKRHKTNWDSPSPSVSDLDSDCTSSGWGTRRKREDAPDGAGLADWTGGIGPAAIDWDNRPKFRPEQSRKRLEEWLDKSYWELNDVKNNMKDEQYAGGDDLISPNIAASEGDVAPRYWIDCLVPSTKAKSPSTIDVFWAKQLSLLDKLEPLLEEDPKTIVPWWKNYQDEESSRLHVLHQPVTSGIDLEEEGEDSTLLRENDFGSNNAAEKRKAAEQAKMQAHRERRLAMRERAQRVSGTHDQADPSLSSVRIKPDLNLFLRPACKEDMIALRDIYNRYVDNAFIVPDITRVTDKDMHNRWRATRDAHLPFIVACQRGEKIKGRSKNRNGGEDIVTPDRVVGFASATPWDGGVGDTIYNSTVNMGIFVHVEFHGKNIGSCLADKMMGLLDQSFAERGGYDAVGDELKGIGLSRVVSNVMVRYPYHPQKKEKLKWATKWLNRRFGFEKTGDLPGIAYKFDEKLNLLILQKATGVTVTMTGGPRENVDA